MPESRILENRLKIVTFSHSFPYKYDCMTMIKSISLTNTTAFTFKLLVAGLRVVNGPFTSQKPATFYTQTALLFFAFNNLTYYGFLFYGIKHQNCQSGVLLYFEYQNICCGSQILIFNAAGWHIRQNISPAVS